PFLDEQTLAVAHVDLSRFDPDALFDWAATGLGKDAAEELGRHKEQAGKEVAAWKKAGVKDLYAVLSLADLTARPPQPPPLVVPLGPGADARPTARALEQAARGLTFEQRGKVLAGGSGATLKRRR